jgi:hypothetical protein
VSTIDVNKETTALRQSRLVDRGNLLKPRGRAELRGAIERWKARGRDAFVVITERGDDLAPWRQLFQALALHPENDLLLLFNGERWEAKGWGLTDREITEALRLAEGSPHAYYARGLVLALDSLGAAAGAPPQAPRSTALTAPPSETSTKGSGSFLAPVGIGVALMVPLAAVWVLRRRAEMGRVRYAEFEKYRLSAEQTYADVMLAAEELPDRGVGEKKRAAELKSRLDRLGREAAAHPLDANDPVLLGKAQQLENEIAVIKSAILQKAKGN